MIKVLPIVLALFLSVSHFQLNYIGENFLTDEIKNPRNHLTQDNDNRNEVKAKVLSVSEASSASRNGKIFSDDENFSGNESDEIILRLTWGVVPGAV